MGRESPSGDKDPETNYVEVVERVEEKPVDKFDFPQTSNQVSSNVFSRLLIDIEHLSGVWMVLEVSHSNRQNSESTSSDQTLRTKSVHEQLLEVLSQPL